MNPGTPESARSGGRETFGIKGPVAAVAAAKPTALPGTQAPKRGEDGARKVAPVSKTAARKQTYLVSQPEGAMVETPKAQRASAVRAVPATTRMMRTDGGGNPPPGSLSSSSLDSSSENSSEGDEASEKLLAKDTEAKRRREQRKAKKLDKRRGEVSFERFEAWSEEVQEWQDDYDLSDYATVTALRHLVEKSAKEWYRANVRGKEESWDVERFMDALFDDIFPSNQ